MSDINAIFRELEEIDEKLDTLPADAYNERITLRERKEDLKAQAADLANHSEALQPTDRLLAERTALVQKLDAIGAQSIDVVMQSGGGGAAGPGAEGLGATGLNRKIDQAQGGEQIRARISEIDTILRDRGVDPDDHS